MNQDAGPRPWGELIPSVEVPVRVANRLEWVRGELERIRLAAGYGGRGPDRVDIVAGGRLAS